jgi:hypothetical protein
MYLRVCGLVVLCLSKDRTATAFRVKQLFSWTWRRYNPSKRRELLAQWHGVASQKTWVFSSSAVTNSNLDVCYCVLLNLSSGFLHWRHCCTYSVHFIFNFLFVTKVVNFNSSVIELNSIHYDCLAASSAFFRSRYFLHVNVSRDEKTRKNKRAATGWLVELTEKRRNWNL